MNYLISFSVTWDIPEKGHWFFGFNSDQLTLIICWMDTIDSNMAKMFYDYTICESDYGWLNPSVTGTNPYNDSDVYVNYADYQILINFFKNTLYPILEDLGESAIYTKDDIDALTDMGIATSNYWLESAAYDLEFFLDAYADIFMRNLHSFEKLYQMAIDHSGIISVDR
ncbi:MAG: hypothetical protein H6607_05970 [Flavobacteriales bacterium]|nr:hypothetical protein [Flavobacteriales bacterium]